MVKIVNVAEIADRDWTFVQRFYPADDSKWFFYSASPQNWLERAIKRPKIGRYRACFQSLSPLKDGQSVVISHLPRTSHWQSKIMKIFGVEARHLAFSFNFTDLPSPRTADAMKESFKRIERFVVYSNYEMGLYSDYFDIPRAKFTMLHWAMEQPKYCNDFIPVEGDYFCSIGGEGRDYETLINSFRKLSHLKLVIVTRPHSLKNILIPDNVTVLYNLPLDQFWAVAVNSKAVVVPLRDDLTPCGHITLVGSMLLAKPIVTTFSKATTDYVSDGKNALVVSPQDESQLIVAINQLARDKVLREEISENAASFAKEHCNLKNWVKFVHSFVKNQPE